MGLCQRQFMNSVAGGLVVVPTELTPALDKKNKESSENQKLRHTPMVILREYFVFCVKIFLRMYEISS